MDTLRVNTFGRAAGHDAAVQAGIYRAENLDVQLQVTQSSKAQMQELIDGVWDVVHTNADNVFWWTEDKGADLLIVLALPGQPNQNLVVRPEIRSYEDLRGKQLAVDAAESGYVTPLRVLLRQAGLRDEGPDFTFVQVGATQARIEALRAGHACGAMVGTGQDGALVAEGFRVLDSINRLYTHYASTAAVRRAWADSNRDLLIRYVRAQVGGALRVQRARAGAGDDEAPPPFAWDGLREMLEMRRDVGLLRGPVDPGRFADDTYYRMAIGTA